MMGYAPSVGDTLILPIIIGIIVVAAIVVVIAAVASRRKKGAGKHSASNVDRDQS